MPDPFDADGYLKTGDILEIAGDDLQYLHYVDRSKDMIVRGGMKISAAELEGFISGHPKIGDVAVVAYPDEVLGERAPLSLTRGKAGVVRVRREGPERPPVPLAGGRQDVAARQVLGRGGRVKRMRRVRASRLAGPDGGVGHEGSPGVTRRR